jgi:catechol 2,3-dioxygenase-like lactoylglutathione lyase family enzyme
MYSKFLLFLCLILFTALPDVTSAASNSDFHISSLYHVGFWVKDITQARLFYHDLLGYDEPYSLNTPQGVLQMVVMKVNDDQVIYLFPNSKKILPNGDNLDHLGFVIDDAQALYLHMQELGIKVKPVHRARVGDLVLTCSDPDGHVFEITQFEKIGELLKHRGKSNSELRISNALVSVSLSVKDLVNSINFYEKVFGFKVKSFNPNSDALISIADGYNTIHLIQSQANTRAVIDYTLEVLDIYKTKTILINRTKALGYVFETSAVLDNTKLWLKDPDGTRILFYQKNKN